MRLPNLDAIWLLLPLVGVVLAASLEPLPPYDFWWHLVMGREIAVAGIPNTQQFLYTMPSTAPFHDQPWLAQWLMYQVHNAAGLVGGMALRTLLLLSAWGVLLWTLVGRSGPRVGGALALVAVIVSYPVLTYRTRLFAFLPFVVLIATLLSDKRPKWGPVWLFVATAWWANVHGTFVLSPVLTFGAFGAVMLEALAQGRLGETFRAQGRWWISALLATFSGALVSPHGFENVNYVVGLAITSNVSATVSEWLPPDLSTEMGVVWVTAFAATMLVLLVTRSKVTVLEAALLLATTYLAASAIRSVFWWTAVAALVVAPQVSRLLERFGAGQESAEPDQGNVMNLAIIGSFLVASIGLHPGVAPTPLRVELGGGRVANSGVGAGILSSEHAIAQVETALEVAGSGRVFHDQALGGVVEWVASTRRPVAFVDQRMELIPEETWAAYFRVSSAVSWRETFEHYDIRAAVLSVEGQWPLVQALEDAPDWTLVGIGQQHWVFARTD